MLVLNKKYNGWMDGLQLKISDSMFKLQHATERAEERGIDLSKINKIAFTVIEMYSDKKLGHKHLINKVLVRGRYDYHFDLCLVVRIEAGKQRLVTAYLNKRTDSHSTLRLSKVTVAENLVCFN